MAVTRSRRPENRGSGARHNPSGGWISNSLRRRKHHDRSPINPCVKYSLFTINFLFLMLSLAVVVLTTYILVQKEKEVNSAIDFIFDPSCLLCLFGSIALVIAFVGCGGALRENITLLKTYYITLSLLLFLEIICVIFVFVFFFVEDAFAYLGSFEDLFKDAVVDYRNDPDVQGAIDSIQEILSCCGASNDEMGFKDWDDNVYFHCNTSNLSPESCAVPFSCCKISEGENINYQCGAGMLEDGASTSGIYVNGCLKGLNVMIEDNIWIVGGVVLGILIPQATLIVFGKGLVSQIEEQKMKW